MPRTLIYGYGNIGRQDDGLGVYLIDKLRHWLPYHGLHDVSLASNFQLNIEDSVDLAKHDLVVFADATKEAIDDIKFDRLYPDPLLVNFTMHAVPPAAILYLCESLHQRRPETYVLRLKGYNWEFQEGLSAKAYTNLEKGFHFLTSFLQKMEPQATNLINMPL
jgi:hydrogenase maturation protease